MSHFVVDFKYYGNARPLYYTDTMPLSLSAKFYVKMLPHLDILHQGEESYA